MNEQLWSDEKIEDASAPGIVAGQLGRFVNLKVVMAMRDEYEARIAELEAKAAQQWQPVAEDNTELIDKLAYDDRRVYIAENGTMLELYLDGLDARFYMPDGYAICRKVQAAQVAPSVQKGETE